MNAKHSDELRAAVAKVAETQTAFWDALSEIERITGCEIDSLPDYTSFTDPSDFEIDLMLGAVAEED